MEWLISTLITLIGLFTLIALLVDIDNRYADFSNLTLFQKICRVYMDIVYCVMLLAIIMVLVYFLHELVF